MAEILGLGWPNIHEREVLYLIALLTASCSYAYWKVVQGIG